jgi:hypothetical protein
MTCVDTVPARAVESYGIRQSGSASYGRRHTKAEVAGMTSQGPRGNGELFRSRTVAWIRRYLPLEIAGTATMLLAASVAYWASGSLAVSAIAGTVGENVGYYGVAAARSWSSWLAAERAGGRRLVALGYTLRGLMIEFGPSEIAYTVVHPVLLFVMPSVLGGTWGGWLVGKLLADLLFYGIAALSYRRFQGLIEPSVGS